MMTEIDRTPHLDDAYPGVEFALTSAERKDFKTGKISFSAQDIMMPANWDHNAVDIMAEKYFRRKGVPDVTVRIHEDGVPEWLQRSEPAEGATFSGETDARQTFRRLAGCWTYWGWKGGYFGDDERAARAFYDNLRLDLAKQHAAPNSPQWFNTGLHWAYGIAGLPEGHWFVDADGVPKLSPSKYERVAGHACFIVGMKDDLLGPSGIMDTLCNETRIFKSGSGSGMNASRLRGKDEPLSAGGKSSGMMSFLKTFDANAGSIKSGGTTRRAAKMVCVDADHPEIETFIEWKVVEESKVAALVTGSRLMAKSVKNMFAAIDASPLADLKERHNPKANAALRTAMRDARDLGVPLNALYQILELKEQTGHAVTVTEYDTNWTSEAYESVAGQNANNSVRLTDEFMSAVENNCDWYLTGRVNGDVVKTIPARELNDKIAIAAWRCADPGLHYTTTIQDWATCPEDGPIRASNPCVTADTLVATSEGMRPIGDLVGSMAFVVGSDGELHPTTRIFPTGTKSVYQLRTRSGYNLKLTADHRVATDNRGDVAAKDLQTTDRIILGKPRFGNVTLDKSEAELIGLALGDGCIVTSTRNRNGMIDHQRTLLLTMHKDEQSVLTSVAATVNAAKSSCANRQGRLHTAVRQTATGSRVTTSLPEIVDELEAYAVLDQGSQNKALTSKVWSLDQQSVAAIIRGYATADGTVANYGDKSQYISIGSTSKVLLEQIQLLLLGFGIKAKLYSNRRAGKNTNCLPDGKGGTKDYGVLETHDLRISRSSRMAFEQLVGFIPASAKANALAELNTQFTTYKDHFDDNFASLEYLGEQPVFDLTEPETSHFVANGLVVHNCSEYLHNDDTACNLASINLVKFIDNDRDFNVERFVDAAQRWTTVLDITNDMAHLPSRDIAVGTWMYRTIGLGYANLGALLMRFGYAYDSENGRGMTSAITALMTGTAYRTSAEMAKQISPFPRYEANKKHVHRVLRNHLAAVKGDTGPLFYENVSTPPTIYIGDEKARAIRKHAYNIWLDAIEKAEKHGVRNAQVSLIAPTGTIGLLMGCDTTGPEPDFALVKFKSLAGGGNMKLVNASVRPALKNLAYSEETIAGIEDYLRGVPTLTPDERKRLSAANIPNETINKMVADLRDAFNFRNVGWSNGVDLSTVGFTDEELEAIDIRTCGHGTIEGAPGLKDEHLCVFDCATPVGRGKRYIAPEGHLKMLAAIQPFISGASSKTVNLPKSATVEDIKNVYAMAHKLAIKAVALYRDGSKLSQPLMTALEDLEEDMGTSVPFPTTSAQGVNAMGQALARKKHPMPKRRHGITQEFTIGGHKIFLTTGEYEDGTPGEIFLNMSKEGAAFRALMNNFAIAVSVGLQWGVPLEEFVDKFVGTRFEPLGAVAGHEHIKFASSLLDAVFRELGMTYLHDYSHANIPPAENILRATELVSMTDTTPKKIAVSTNGHVVSPMELVREAKMKGYTGDPCQNDKCGAMTLVVNGSCKKCDTCGETTGCS
jgi:ribonucleoside-diphosphate reductase alpha chain